MRSLRGNDRNLLALLGLHADLSLRQMAQRSSHQLHTVRSWLERLEKEDVLRRVWIVDVFLLGWQRHQILFSVAGRKRSLVNDLTEYFKQSPNVQFLADIAGDYDFEVVVLARELSEVFKLLQDATKKFGDVFFSKTVTMQPYLAFFPRKYLASKKFAEKPLEIKGGAQKYELNEIEMQILRALSRSPKIQKKELSETVGVSRVTIDAHMKRLRQAGVIQGAAFSVNSVEYGAQNYKLLLFFKGFSLSTRETLYKLCYEHPHCTNFVEGFGGADYELGVEVENYLQLLQLKREIGEMFDRQLAEIKIVPRFTIHKYIPFPF